MGIFPPIVINLLCWQIKKSPGMPGLFVGLVSL